jgi:hypothetical protein
MLERVMVEAEEGKVSVAGAVLRVTLRVVLAVMDIAPAPVFNQLVVVAVEVQVAAVVTAVGALAY